MHGPYLPERVVSNEELAQTVDTTDAWIVERTGIRSRHIAAEGEKPSQLLLWSTIAVVAATFAIPFLGTLTSVFGFVPLSAPQLIAIAAIVLGYIVATELTKAWYFRSERSGAGHGKKAARVDT